MLIPYNNSIHVSQSPHSVGVQNNLTIPIPWADNNWFVNNQKKFAATGMMGLGLGCTSCSGGSGGMGDITAVGSDLSMLFSDTTDMLSTFTMIDWIGILGISTALYFLTTKKESGKRKTS